MKIKNLIFIRTLRPQLAAKFDTYKYSNRYSSISRVSNHAIFVSLDFSRFTTSFISLFYIVIYGAWILYVEASNYIGRASLAQRNDAVKFAASSLNLVVAKFHLNTAQCIYFQIN